MGLKWTKEPAPCWDETKRRIVGRAPTGIFDPLYAEIEPDVAISAEWWRVEDGDRVVVGYGWLDVVWGDAEILLACDPSAFRRGVGTFILEQLENECRSRNLNYLYNIVRPEHPDADGVTRFLMENGFKLSSDGSLKRAVTHR